MRRTITFLGNYQAHTLHIAWLNCIPNSGDYDSRHVDYLKVSDADRSFMEAADVIVAQVSDRDYYCIEPNDVKAKIVRFPYVHGSFLWPHAGHAHPDWGSSLMCECPGVFAGETGDGFLNRLYHQHISADEAVDRYASLDIVRSARIDRLYEISLALQRQRDSKSGLDVDMAGYIERNLGREILFHSRQRLAKPIFWHFVRNVFANTLRALGENDRIAEEAARHSYVYMGRTLEAPIHPNLVRYFNIPDRPDNYKYRVNRTRLTFNQNTYNYVGGIFPSDIYAGIRLLDHQEFENALPILRRGLELTPDSPDGASAISRALTQLGRHEEALEMACVTVHGDDQNRDHLVELAECYKRAKMPLAAQAALVRALEIHPCHLLGNQMLSDLLVDLGRRSDAIALIRELADKIPSTSFAHVRLERLLLDAGDREGAERVAREAISAGMHNDATFHILTDAPMRVVFGERIDLRFVVEGKTVPECGPDGQNGRRTAADVGNALSLKRPDSDCGDFILMIGFEPCAPRSRCMSVFIDGELLLCRSVAALTEAYCLLPVGVATVEAFDLTLAFRNGGFDLHQVGSSGECGSDVILNRVCIAEVQRPAWDGYADMTALLADLEAGVLPSIVHDLAWDGRDSPHLTLPRGTEPRTVHTSFGTILYADRESGRVRHGKIGEVPSNLFLVHRGNTAILARADDEGGYVAVKLRPEGPYAPIGDWTPLIGGRFVRMLTMTTEVVGRPQTFGLQGAGLFACAEHDGTLTLSRVRPGPWESFSFHPIER